MGYGLLIITMMSCLSSEANVVLNLLVVPLWYEAGSYAWWVSTSLGRLDGRLVIVIKVGSWQVFDSSITAGPSPT